MRWERIEALALAAGVLAAGAVACSDDEGVAGDDVDVALVGDSFAEQSGDAFRTLADDEGLTIAYHAYGGAALCDWDDELRQLIEREPEYLVLSFAGDDVTPCINPTGENRDGAVVAADYRREIDQLIALFRSAGTQLFVVEPPPMRDAAFEARAEAMRDMYQELATDSPRVSVIKTAPALGPDGRFHQALPCLPGEECGRDGTVLLRHGDGIHLTRVGGRRYAQAIMDEIREHEEVD